MLSTAQDWITRFVYHPTASRVTLALLALAAVLVQPMAPIGGGTGT